MKKVYTGSTTRLSQQLINLNPKSDGYQRMQSVVLAANWPAGILEIPPGELQPTLSSLVKVLGYILNSAPVLTRVLLNQFDMY